MNKSSSRIPVALVWAILFLTAVACGAKKEQPAQEPTPKPVADQVVSIPDVNFAAAVWSAINKTSGELYRSELINLTALDIPGRGIIGLAGIEHCASLMRLNLSGNYLRDLAPMAQVRTLTVLDLSNNYIVDISPLRGLTGLKELNLRNNQITDISALAPLVNLVRLDLSTNLIADLAPLAGLTKLHYLDLSANKFTDLEAVRQICVAGGLGPGAVIDLTNNPLGNQAVLRHIPFFKSGGAVVKY